MGLLPRIEDFADAHFDLFKALGLAGGDVHVGDDLYPELARQRSADAVKRVAMQPGDPMAVCLAAANRDPAALPDPCCFDTFRDGGKHKAFGYGNHVCIGQHLARLEMSAALNALLNRLPTRRLDPDHPAPTIDGLSRRDPRALQARFD